MNPPYVQPYLAFAGNCEAALAHYQKHLGAEVAGRVVVGLERFDEPGEQGLVVSAAHLSQCHRQRRADQRWLQRHDGRQPVRRQHPPERGEDARRGVDQRAVEVEEDVGRHDQGFYTRSGAITARSTVSALPLRMR